MPIIEKVTAFITRPARHGHDLLLFEHPFAGIQIPAGSVEPGETARQAALREAIEETGLTALSVVEYLGCQEDKLGDDQRAIATATTVYARPDVTSFDWAHLPRGIWVTVERHQGSFTQIKMIEYDRVPDPQYISLFVAL